MTIEEQISALEAQELAALRRQDYAEACRLADRRLALWRQRQWLSAPLPARSSGETLEDVEIVWRAEKKVVRRGERR